MEILQRQWAELGCFTYVAYSANKEVQVTKVAKKLAY